MRATRPVLIATVLAGAALLSACAPKAGSSTPGAPASTSSAAASTCTPAQLKTYKADTLTVATDQPVYEPWFVDNTPTNGKGFESAVAYAVAKKLGYSNGQVTWTRASFDSVVTPSPKKYDFDINEFSITSERAKAVDFSSGYYDVAQAVVTLKGGKYAGVTTVAGLKGAKLGAQIGTTSLTAIASQIKPSSTPGVFDTNDLAVQALKNKQIDGLVVDLPTAEYVTSEQIQGAAIVGTLPQPASPEQFGLVLSKGSSLTSCVSQAVDALRSDGTLATLQKQWLSSFVEPELK